jgi:hypothetical protein
VVSITPRSRFTPGERTPGTHWIGGWVGPRAGLDAGARRKIRPCRGSNLDRPIVQPVDNLLIILIFIAQSLSLFSITSLNITTKSHAVLNKCGVGYGDTNQMHAMGYPAVTFAFKIISLPRYSELPNTKLLF